MDYENVLGERKFPTYEQLKTGLLRLIDEGKISREDASRLLPELRESEDERIRKVIFKLLLGMREEIFTSQDDIVTKEKALAYLEKQKEQKLAPDDLQKSFEAGQKSIVDNPEQYGLCKKAEWSEEDEQFLLICKNALYKYQRTDKWDANIISKWLEERLKSLRPSWKPTEKQKKAIHFVAYLRELDFYGGIKDTLREFDEQLKKL